jgi:DNA-binding GntR family transcriptional regulator
VVRRTIEVSAARAGGSTEQVGRVAEAVASGRDAAASDDLDALATANQQFHRRIVQMAGSQRLNMLMDQVLAEMRLFYHKESVDVGFYTRYLADNEEIAQLLMEGSFARAADLLEDYLNRSEEHLVAIYSDQAASAPQPRRRGRPRSLKAG